MKKKSDKIDWSKARRITPHEVEMYRRAIEEKLGVPSPRRGRPVKSSGEKFVAISIRLDPRALDWARREAKRRGVGYQTVINETLLKRVGLKKAG
jgi:uncharacterized protein (DUF4415 family)